MTHPNVKAFMDLSTAHISPSTREWLTRAAGPGNFSNWVASTPYGWFTYCTEDDDDNDVPADLRACMEYAKQHGAFYILFDCDAQEVDDLHTFAD
jgi:hypothetical protein